MADKAPDPTTTEPNPDDVEKAYWDKLIGTLDTWFDSKVERIRQEGISSGRSGRNSLPAFMADLMFGKVTDKK